MLRSAAAADVQTIAAALIAVINSLPSGVECVQLYRAVQNVTIAAKDTLTRNRCLRANIEGVADPDAYVIPWRSMRGASRFSRERFRRCCPVFILGSAYIPARSIPLNGRRLRHPA